MATDDDDLLPLSRLFTPRPRNHRHHLTLPSCPSPQPPPNGIDAVFSIGDLVWVKAFPYTWWPGILRRFRGTFVLVYLFGGDERPRWFRLLKLRPFEEGYAVSSKTKLKAQIALALEEVGRRTLLGLMCPCQRTLVDPRRLPLGEAERTRREFSSAGIVHFVRQRAVCAWGDGNGEDDDPLVVKFLAGIIAFRRSFGFVARGKGAFDAKRLVGTVLDMSVGIPVGNATGRTVEVVMAYRRFVSETPSWVFQEVIDFGDDSSNSEGSDSEEEPDVHFVGSFCTEDTEGAVDAYGDNVEADILGDKGGSLNIIIDSTDESQESTDIFQETRIVADSSLSGISSVSPQIDTPKNGMLNAEMDVDSSIEIAKNTVEETQMIDDRLDLQSGKRVILKEQPVTFLESGKEQGRVSRRCRYRFKGESPNILQEALTELHSLASDPCHSLKKNHKAKFSRLLELRSFLFLNEFDRESVNLVAVPDDSETSNIPAQKLIESSPTETDISPVGGVILDPQRRDNHAADRSHHLSDAPLGRQLFSPSSESKFTERTYEYLCHLKNVAVDIFSSEDCFAEETCQKLLHYRKLAFLNKCHNSVDRNVQFCLESGDEMVSRNKQSMQIKGDPENSCTEMDEVPNTTEKSTSDHHVVSRISADNDTEDTRMCIATKDTDFQNQFDSGILIEACGNAEPVSSMSGAFRNVSGFEKRIPDESASGSCEIQQAEILRQEIDLDNSSTEKILHVDRNAADNMDIGSNPLNDHASSQCLDSNGDDGKKKEARLLVAKGHVMKQAPTSKDIFHGKKKHEHALPYQSKVQKPQPGFSLGRLYASPLMAETSKPAQKLKSANSSKCFGLCKTLHMKFPKDFKLPSKEELEKKFRVFGRLDRSKTKIFFYTGAAKVVFLQATDARAAYIYANKKKVFTCVDVRFWFDEHEMFREGNSRGPLPISSRERSLNLKSCLRKPDPHKEKDERKEHKVKFTTDSPCPSIATTNPECLPSTVSDTIPSQDEDISEPMLHLLVKCDKVVSEIKKTLGLESYYSIVACTYGLSAES